jgi:hypothetical protein
VNDGRNIETDEASSRAVVSTHLRLKWAVVSALIVIELVVGVAIGRPIDELLPLLFADACIFRVYSLLRSVAWLWVKADDFREAVRTTEFPSDEEARTNRAANVRRRKQIVGLYEKTGGNFFPFGIRAIRLDDWSLDIPKTKRPRRFIGRLAYKLWKFYFFAPLAVIYEYLMTFPFRHTHELQHVLIVTGGVAVLVGGLVIAVEGVLSYINFQSWSVAYHRLDVRSNNAVSEFSAFVGGAATAFASAAGITTYVAVTMSGFALADKGSSWWRLIGQGYYYSLTAFTGNGDAGPRIPAAFLVTALIYLAGVTYLVVVISLLIDSIGQKKEDPKADALGQTQ